MNHWEICRENYPKMSFEKDLCPGLAFIAKKNGFEFIPYTVSDQTKAEWRSGKKTLLDLMEDYRVALESGVEEIEL